MLTIPKGLPIKFWLNGQETFNQKEEPGVEPRVFHQLYNNADEIKIRILDDEAKNYLIVVTDLDGNELEEIPFTAISSEDGFVYTCEFTFGDFDLEDGLYKLLLYSQDNFGEGTIEAPIGVISAGGVFTATPSEFTGDGDVTAPIGTISGGGVFHPYASLSFRLSAIVGDICTAPTMTLYFLSAPAITGTQVFIDKEFSAWPVGYNYIVAALGHNTIYEYNDIDGTIGADTGLTC